MLDTNGVEIKNRAKQRMKINHNLNDYFTVYSRLCQELHKIIYSYLYLAVGSRMCFQRNKIKMLVCVVCFQNVIDVFCGIFIILYLSKYSR